MIKNDNGPDFSLKSFNSVYFIGIGGIGMSGIAHLMRSMNYSVSGSDMEKSLITRRLEDMRIKVFYSHCKSNIGSCDLVVVSSAIKKDNPEIIEAKRRKIPIVRRAEMLAKIAELKKTITVSGTHGKTTVTSMLGSVFEGAREDATVVVGGLFRNTSSNIKIGASEYFVTEADESDGSFLCFSPLVTCITNIDADHMDHYKNEHALREAFIRHVFKIPFFGAVILCSDDEGVKSIMDYISAPVITYGLNNNFGWMAKDLEMTENGTKFTAYFKGEKRGAVEINMSGKHNVLNALCAIACGGYLGFDFAQMAGGLKKFSGVKRRMEDWGAVKGIRFIDDYGHHPTEIKATLEAISSAYKPKRIITVFQPHRYSRTKELCKEFARSFKLADIVYLMDVYPAGEHPIKGVSSNLILNAAKREDNAKIVPFRDSFSVAKNLSKGDVVLTIGAGDVWKTGEDIKLKFEIIST